jgi:hypothetical protein
MLGCMNWIRILLMMILNLLLLTCIDTEKLSLFMIKHIENDYFG